MRSRIGEGKEENTIRTNDNGSVMILIEEIERLVFEFLSIRGQRNRIRPISSDYRTRVCRDRRRRRAWASTEADRGWQAPQKA